LPKTACAFSEKVLTEKAGGKRVLAQHASVRSFRDTPTAAHYGTIVDPATWYARLWNHATDKGTRPNGRVALYSHGPQPAMLAWLPESSLDWPTFFRGVIDMKPTHVQVGRELIITASDEPHAIPYRGGLWSWAVKYMYRRGGEWRVEALIDGNCPEAALAALGVDASEHQPYNTSNQRGATISGEPQVTTYESWYTPEMLSALFEADREMIELLGYTRPFAPSVKGPLIPLA